ncbi:hypothetical protein OH76DRAFT_1409589 [Lentinus brumalis]|uniref:Secreted protein n=1 Tax=Lentinus brumalis TaxID=2498619 RepID=A0A371CUG2_9APHY|nr:hypothetical protein OH76DRAFT_1409589 [Polyporus brumalis]
MLHAGRLLPLAIINLCPLVPLRHGGRSDAHPRPVNVRLLYDCPVRSSRPGETMTQAQAQAEDGARSRTRRPCDSRRPG